MKRILAVMLVAIMLVTFCSCGGKGGESGDVPTLTWLVPGEAQPDVAKVMAEANKIIEPAIGAKLDLQFIDAGSFRDRMTMNMASGKEYDLCFVGYCNPYYDAAQKGGLMEIGEIMKKEAPDLYKSLPDYAWESTLVNGGIYAVPNMQIYARQESLIVKRDLAEKYDLKAEDIKTMSDIEPFLAKIKAGEKDVVPYRSYYGIWMWYYDKYEEILGSSIGGIGIKSDGSSKKAVWLFDTPEYKQGLKDIRSWYEKGYIRSDAASVTDDAMDFKAGKYAVSQDVYKPGFVEGFSKNYDFDINAIPVMKPYVYSSNIVNTMIGVGASSKNPVKAVKLIELMNTNKELYNLISYGIEGEHYTLTDEGKVSFVEGSGYYHNSAWMFGNQFNAIVVDGQDDDVWEQTIKMNDEARKSPILGFVFDKSKVLAEISQCQTITGEYAPAINKGVRDPEEYWDTYMKRMKEAGCDKILDEVNRQLDEYFKNKK